LENSRRFRALPVYAVLLSEGKWGMIDIAVRMIRLARGIANIIKESEHYTLVDEKADIEDINIIVLFRAKDDQLNEKLVNKIQASREWYVSGTKWNGQSACRVAVASWRVDVAKDLELVRRSLATIAEEHIRNR
jgi:glutamate/tyrosine decarboxylase-like PLP-dependent enzyme